MKKLTHILYHAIFWGWNLTFLFIVCVGFLPYIIVPVIQDAIAGTVPTSILFSVLVLILVPILCTGIGLIRLQKYPVLLMRLFYGVEAPLFALCLLRLFILREMTAATTLLLGTVALCIAAFGVELLGGYAAQKRSLARVQMASHSLMLIVAVYLGVLLTFYVVPSLYMFVYEFLKFGWLREIEYLLSYAPFKTVFWAILSLVMFATTCTLFFAMPFAMVNLYARSWWRIWSAFGRQHGQLQGVVNTGGVVIVWFLAFLLLQNQPQVQAFELLQRPTTTDGSRQELLSQSNQIREGLLNAYLSSYRYLSPRKDSNQLREWYRSLFNLSEQDAQFWQDFHNHWLSPFLYDGDRSDADKAAELYGQFFDTPIQKAERMAIQHALESTVNRDETEAGLLNINQRIVRLAQQGINVQEHGDWAEIELYEQYENSTNQDQEIFYSFSLPESAVITGVWLGDSMDRGRRFNFTVSPRGAAQQVYKGEVERSNVATAEDPALLEQVGPRQYRLRVFPIPARELKGAPGHLHLWLTYQVMRRDNHWSLPHLTEKRNIFWTKDTARLRNGRRTKSTEDAWLEASIPASAHAPTLHQVTLPGGFQVTAKPLNASDYQLPQHQRFALVLDSSRSMAGHRAELRDTFQWLNQHEAGNDVDLYLTASPGADPVRLDDLRPVDPMKLTFYGHLQLPEMLQQFTQLQGNTVYDAVLVLTDDGSYELSKDTTTPVAIAPPLWAIHLGGHLPQAYDDASLQLIQKTRGGVADNLPVVMQRLATEAALGTSVASVTDGYVWSVTAPIADNAQVDGAIADIGSIPPGEGTLLAALPPQTPTDPFAPLAARQLILKLSREQDMTQLAALDRIHGIAKSAKIVTPYSSMLVLVNNRQRQLLRQAEASSDRFHREVEDGTDELSQPANPMNTSVPEPSTVIGVGIVAIVIFIQKRYPVKS